MIQLFTFKISIHLNVNHHEQQDQKTMNKEEPNEVLPIEDLMRGWN